MTEEQIASKFSELNRYSKSEIIDAMKQVGDLRYLGWLLNRLKMNRDEKEVNKEFESLDRLIAAGNEFTEASKAYRQFISDIGGDLVTWWKTSSKKEKEYVLSLQKKMENAYEAYKKALAERKRLKKEV